MSIADRVAKRFLAQQEHQAVAPPGWDKSVERMKKHDEIDNPFALAWHMHNKGDKPHPKKKEAAIKQITKVEIREYSDNGQTKAYVHWIDDHGKSGTTEGDPSNAHMRELINRAHREKAPVKNEKWASRTAGAFAADGSVNRKLEAASIMDGNGGLYLTIYENENPNKMRGASDRPYRSYKVVSTCNHFGVGVESEFPISNAKVARWLIAALQRTLPTIEANESKYSSDYNPRPTVMNGEAVPDPRHFSTYQSDSK